MSQMNQLSIEKVSLELFIDFILYIYSRKLMKLILEIYQMVN